MLWIKNVIHRNKKEIKSSVSFENIKEQKKSQITNCMHGEWQKLQGAARNLMCQISLPYIQLLDSRRKEDLQEENEAYASSFP